MERKSAIENLSVILKIYLCLLKWGTFWANTVATSHMESWKNATEELNFKFPLNLINWNLSSHLRLILEA